MDYQHLISDCVKQIPPSGIRKYFDFLDDSHISLGVGEPDFPTPDRIRKYVAERLKNADAAFTNRARLGEAEFSQAPNLRFLGLFATGYDKIDLLAARRHNVAVCNAPGYSTDAVAQHTIALLLELTNRTRALDAELRKGRWTQHAGDCVWDAPLIELTGKTFGILGTGAIGCQTARIASALGMRVIGHSRKLRAEFQGSYVSLEELFRQSDVLSLHCAATPVWYHSSLMHS